MTDSNETEESKANANPLICVCQWHLPPSVQKTKSGSEPMSPSVVVLFILLIKKYVLYYMCIPQHIRYTVTEAHFMEESHTALKVQIEVSYVTHVS
jgi:hypothetical protein